MDPRSYAIAWGLYILAGAVFSALSWRVLWRYCWRELAILLEIWLLVLIYVPAEVVSDPTFMAPALIVFMMDTLTIDATAGIDALTRLVVGIIIGFLATGVISVVLHLRRRKQMLSPE